MLVFRKRNHSKINNGVWIRFVIRLDLAEYMFKMDN